MKIGTKANAIDDLGKFDGSKMTIKVNGKQIYPQKRYAIVRVDDKCPQDLEDDIKRCVGEHCKNCRYGDTKEQLIKKVAQALLIKELEWYRKTPNCDITKSLVENSYRYYLEKAKFVVEFLGVEE